LPPGTFFKEHESDEDDDRHADENMDGKIDERILDRND